MLIDFVEKDYSTSSLEAKRKFQRWRPSTSTLLLDVVKMNQGDNHEVHRECVKDKVQDVFEAFKPLSKSKDRDFFHHLLMRHCIWIS